MNYKKVLYLFLSLIPTLSFADACLNIEASIIGEKGNVVVEIENAKVSRTQKNIYSKDNIEIDAKVLSENEKEMVVELTIYEDHKLLLNPVLVVEWDQPAWVKVEDKDSFEVHKLLELVVVANKTE